jgi:thiamine-phosphate pyrophosphorylase
MSSIAGLYAITPEGIEAERLLGKSRQALAGGARVMQYRDKSTDHAQRARLALALAALCREHAAVFIVNDDVELALRSGAHGVHLGRDDIAIGQAREALGPQAVIGASCYDDLDRAERAVSAGADYLAFGSFFPSSVKPNAVRPALNVLREARRRFRLPLVAIGGITPHNAASVIEAGADAAAVVTALFDVEDTLSAARAFARLFRQNENALS